MSFENNDYFCIKHKNMETSAFISGFNRLPERIQQQVVEYTELLLATLNSNNKKKNQFQFDWEDGLSGLKNKYSSVELQHQANTLR